MALTRGFNYLLILIFFVACSKQTQEQQVTDACSLVEVTHSSSAPLLWSPDHSKYLINKQDHNGIFQIYLGNSTDTTLTCISLINPGGLFRSWDKRNKLQVQWHPSGLFIVCAVEKEYYNELLYTPYSTRLGWLQSGLWMDMWCLSVDGTSWHNLATTEHGFTGPAITPDGKIAAWAEALEGSNLAINVFGNWKLHLSDIILASGSLSLSQDRDITPLGARWVEPGNFSPDGHSLLISADIGMSNAEGQDQFIVDINNGQVVNLTNSPKVWDEHGRFSPDGNKILFMSSYPYKEDTNSYHTFTIKTEFMLMNKDGSHFQQLTHFKTSGYPESSPGIAATGFWTPTDSKIYAQSLIFPDYDNWVIRFQGPCGNK